LFVAKAVKGASPTHNNAGNVSTPPEPAIEEINPAKKATATNTICVKKLNSIQISS
jgi:hypothetical protein